MTHLISFVHISTSYCHCTEVVLEERNYQCSIQPEVVIDTVTNLTDDVLNAMTPKILHGQPNTYAFSKALSEDLVQRCGLPAAIARPSIGKHSFRLVNSFSSEPSSPRVTKLHTRRGHRRLTYVNPF